MDIVLNKFSKSQLNLEEYNSIKKALGLSTSSVMHKWNQSGVDNIEGYANYIEHSSKLIKIMKNVGYIGVGLDFAGYSANVYDACSRGREDACKKAAITEYSKFGFKQGTSMGVGWASGLAARGACMWVLGLVTTEVGAVGASLCFVTGVGVSIGTAKVVEDSAEHYGELFGEHIIYEQLFKK